MATDYAKLSENLSRFYDFRDKTILYVGAAGRQLLDPRTPARKLIAIDRDQKALEELKANVVEQDLRDSVEVIGAGFEEIMIHGDVVYLEFCLHEMDDAEQALRHAKSLAPDIVVYDHSPDSEWIFYGAEEDKVARSSAAMQRCGIRRRQTFRAEQRFANHAELLAKVGPQGAVAIERTARFAGATSIVIPMNYELNLL